MGPHPSSLDLPWPGCPAEDRMQRLSRGAPSGLGAFICVSWNVRFWNANMLSGDLAGTLSHRVLVSE